MANFNTGWNKENRPDKSDRLRESIKKQQPLKPRIEFARNKIQIQSQKLGSTLEKLKAREKTLFNEIISNLQKHNVQQGKVMSNELAQIKKTIKTTSGLKVAIEQIHMRLDSTIDIGDVMTSVGPAMRALTNMRSGLSLMMPDVDLQIGEINGVFNDVLMNAGSIGNTSFAFDVHGEDMDKILAEATAVAEQRVNETLPDVPVRPFSDNSRSSMTEPSQ
jgi:division protein CdvB (Snf7/Vps24/ESCRT-III family)